ncbi:MAG: Asp-tRNA(Asn)/Glu-tRNA(Gln) amidotransferase subunit GatB [Bacteroidota bacterium]|nr:Asp-tRNA(Asn)/Glu-tRNA(Gln) amidotransferase subunit GatB [Bacteroidota bacterium]MDP4249088.1 Asp-tRNA(Asn)/Glu-tRNA(Gln) amidotransferase subunit GatB [Bacteroidota bacterium]
MEEAGKYETVVGLEVHAQLLTNTKLFCGDSAQFGAEPNTHISPVTLGYPGTLPVLNKQAVAFAIKMGFACHSEIERHNYFARKNYFYPDLPKGYQISQHTTPICKGGFIRISTASGVKHVQLNRIHLEEDAGKSIHDRDPDYTCLDFNRAGVPLIEIVTEPCLSSGDEAAAYLLNLRRILRYLEICDGNMEEGSMRCDANISIRERGETMLGTKVEVKNLNSIRNVKRAVEYEASRMMEDVGKGKDVLQQTRRFDALSGTTFSMRSKEEANDYRYFPDPDLPPFQVTDAFLQNIKENIPDLPDALIERYTRDYHLPRYDAEVICDDKETSDYFELLIQQTGAFKAAANWLLGPVKSYLNENNLTISKLPLKPSSLVSLILMVEEGKINFSIASSRIFPELARGTESDPLQLAVRLNLLQTGDEDQIQQWVMQALEKMPEKVEEYKKGKKGLLGLFVGEVKKISKGKADPKLTNELLIRTLEK